MMLLPLAEVAARTGMARSSIYRLIDEGKLSATTDHRGKKVVELTELLRVFGSIGQDETSRQEQQENKKHNPVRNQYRTAQDSSGNVTTMILEVEQLRAQLQIKDMELKLKDREISITQERLQEVKQTAQKMQDEKDQLLNIIHRQTLLLEAPKPPIKAPAAPRKAVARKTSTITKQPAVKVTAAKKPSAPAKPNQKNAAAATAKKTAKATGSPKKASKVINKSR